MGWHNDHLFEKLHREEGLLRYGIGSQQLVRIAQSHIAASQLTCKHASRAERKGVRGVMCLDCEKWLDSDPVTAEDSVTCWARLLEDEVSCG